MAEELKTVAPEGGAPAATPAAEPSPSQKTLEPMQPVEVMVPPEKPPHQDYVPQDESEQMLLGPTSRPQENVGSGMSPKGTLLPPKGIKSWFPSLDRASQDPEAPPQLKLLIQLLAHHMDNT